VELLALVKHDCPVCDQVLPVLDSARQRGAAIRILSQSGLKDTEDQARRLNLATVPELDVDLGVSARFDPDAVRPWCCSTAVPRPTGWRAWIGAA
jgi:hypothetical protein